MTIRVGTFNCENLFSRSRILDFNATPAQAAKATAALKAAEQLKAILNKKTFTAADKAKIPALIKLGKGFLRSRRTAVSCSRATTLPNLIR